MNIPKLQSHQRGLSLISLFLFGIIAVFLVVLGMRVLPTVTEFMAVQSAIQKIASSGETSPTAIGSAFDKIAAVDDIASIRGRDLLVERTKTGVMISFRYEKRVPLYGLASLALDYKGSAKVGGAPR
ncbi:MAG: DUF4845 domain-containing protein [Quisquiliibacterium sp.]